MSVYATFPLNSSLSGRSLVGQTPPIRGGVLYHDARGATIPSGGVEIDALGYVYSLDPDDACSVGIPTAGTVSATQTEITFNIKICS
jgi:hypothetical protein